MQSELSDTEEKIAYARQFYNSNVLSYNQKVATVPTGWLPKSRFGTDGVMTPCESPVPETDMKCGVPGAFETSLTTADRGPATVGVNSTLMVQEAEGASEAPQLLFWAKSSDGVEFPALT